MKNHGVKPEKLYPTMQDEPEEIYPYISVPYEVIDHKQYQPGDKVRVELLIDIQSIDEHCFSGKLIESEVETDEDEEKEGEKVTPSDT